MDIIDEGGVRIVPVINVAEFSARVKRGVATALKGVDSQVRTSLRPVDKTIQNSIVRPFERAATKVTTAARVAGKGIERGIEAGADAAGRQIDELTAKATAELSGITADIDVDTLGAQLHLDEFIALNDGRTINIDVDVDRDSLGGALSGITAGLAGLTDTLTDVGSKIADVFTKAGSQATEFGATGSKGVSAVTTSIGGLTASGPAGVAVIGALVAVAIPAAAALTAVAGAVQTSLGALIPLVPIVGSLGLAFATVKVGLSGIPEAMKAQSDAQKELAETGEISAATQERLDAAMQGLAPSARKVTTVLSGLSDQFGKIQNVVQQNLFAGLAGPLQKLGDTYLPVIGAALSLVADLLNGVIKDFIDFATQSSVVQKVSDTFAGLIGILDSILPAIGNVLGGLGNLFAGAIPGAQRMSDAILDWSERFREWTARITNDGSFQRFIDRAIDAASAIGRTIVNIGRAFGNIFNQGSDTGVRIITKIGDAFRDFNDYLNSADGKKALRGWFQTGEDLVDVFLDAVKEIGPIFDDIGQGLADLEPILDPIFTVLDKISSPAGPLFALVDLIEDLTGAIGDIPGLPDWMDKLLFGAASNGGGASFFDNLTAAAEKAATSSGITNLMNSIEIIKNFGEEEPFHFEGGTFTRGEGFTKALESLNQVRDTTAEVIGNLGAFAGESERIAAIVDANVTRGSERIRELIGQGGALNSVFAGAPHAARRFLSRIGPILNANLVTPMQVARGKVEKNTTLTVAQFRSLPPRVQKVLKTLGVNIVRPVSDATKRARDVAKRGISLTAKQFEELPKRVRVVLRNLGVIVKGDLKKGLDDGTKETKKGKEKIVKEARDIEPQIRKATRNAADPVRENLDRGLDRAKVAVTNGVNAIARTFGTLPRKIQDSASAVGNSLRNLVSNFNSAANGVNSAVNNINADIARIKTEVIIDVRYNSDGRPAAQSAHGRIVNRKMLTWVGEGNKPEVILPLVPTLSKRSLYLMKQSGLLDRPDVQQAVAARAPVQRRQSSSAIDEVFTAISTATVVSVQPTRQINQTYNQQFTLLPNGDPYTHAVQFAARVAASAQR